jgi:hypothetical protein
MPTIGGDNGVSMGEYDYGVATLKYCYILAGSKDPLNSYHRGGKLQEMAEALAGLHEAVGEAEAHQHQTDGVEDKGIPLTWSRLCQW